MSAVASLAQGFPSRRLRADVVSEDILVGRPWSGKVDREVLAPLAGRRHQAIPVELGDLEVGEAVASGGRLKFRSLAGGNSWNPFDGFDAPVVRVEGLKNLVELVFLHLSVGRQRRPEQSQHADFGLEGVLHGEGSIGGRRLKGGVDVA